MERVKYHKDKFICPALHNEMQSMEVKKSGKVEHSDNSHDDNVFSYLMALYVWYDGKNLAENFGIRKSTLKTDENEEIEEIQFEDAIEPRDNITFDVSLVQDTEDSKGISRDLDWVDRDARVFKTARSLREEQYTKLAMERNKMYATHDDLKEQLESRETGVISYGNYMANSYTQLPEDIFNAYDDDYHDTDWDDEMPNNPNKVLQGNLSSFYDMI